MSDIFISYAREDREKAQAIAAVFQGQSWSVWWDRSIPPGRSFDQVIEEALAAARCVVVIWSKSSATSDWVKTEAAEGLARKILVPVQIEELSLPLEFRRLQTVDLTAWDESSAAPELRGLLRAVAVLLKSDLRQSAPPIPPRARTKAVIFALGVLVLLVIGWSSFKFNRSRTGPQPSPTHFEAGRPDSGAAEVTEDIDDGVPNSRIYQLKNGRQVRLVGSLLRNDSNVAVRIIRNAIEDNAWRYNRCYDLHFGQIAGAMPEGNVDISFDISDQLPRHASVMHSDFEYPAFGQCVEATLLGQTINAAGPHGAGKVLYRFRFLPN